MNGPTFGHGAIAEISNVMRKHGITKPLIITDAGIVAAGLLDTLRSHITNDIQYEIFDKTPENPTQVATEDAIEMYKERGCDGVVSMGGGSSIDLGKAVSVVAHLGGSIQEYSINAGGLEKIDGMAPMVAIPTTSGTGSEVSNAAVIVMRDGHKFIVASPKMVPAAAICDPDLTLGLPPKLTAGAGMDAMAHCIEAILVPRVNPPAEAVGIDGIMRGIAQGALERAVKDGQDKDARWNMMMASTEGAMAFSKGLGGVHTMSHACGALPDRRLHHGTLNGILLPYILRYSKDACEDKFKRIALAMGLTENADIVDAISSLNQRIGIPETLGEYGVKSDDIEFLVDHAMLDPINFTLAKPIDKDGYVKLFEEAIG